MKLWVAQFLGVYQWFIMQMDNVVVIDLLQDCQVFSPFFICYTIGRWWQGRAALVGGRSVWVGRALLTITLDLSRHPIGMIEHPHSDVSNVGFVAILWLPTGIEEFGIYLYVVRAQFVGYFLPTLHTIFVRP